MARKFFCAGVLFAVLPLVAVLSLAAPALAQSPQSVFDNYKKQQEAAFNRHKQEQTKAFNDYKKRQMAVFDAYANSMRQQWEEYTAKPRMVMPLRPEPTEQPVRPDNVTAEDYVMPVAKVVPKTVEALNRKAGGELDNDIPDDFFDDLLGLFEEDEPAPGAAKQAKAPGEGASGAAGASAGAGSSAAPTVLGPASGFEFTYRHTPCRVRMGKDFEFDMPGTDENCCADAWMRLSKAGIDTLIKDCAALKRAMQLNDWGYLDLLRSIGDAFYKNNPDKSTFFRFMVMVMSDYRVKICRADKHLYLMAHIGEKVYSYNFLDSDGPKYYILTQKEVDNLSVMKMPREGRRAVSLVHAEIPALDYDAAPARVVKLQGEEDESLTLKVKPNKNLIEYYNNYPQTDKWNYYVSTSLSRNVKDELYPFLKKQIEGKSEKEAVGFLLGFVQHSFKYKTDGEQFGYERAFFGDETFYYPYNDCEDRAILLSILVGDLLGLNVVLLEYEGHLSTAIRFNEPVGGSAFELSDGKYVCCDPTYIGAGVGESMPQYKDKGATVIRL